MTEPAREVSWLVIEPGWKVATADGEEAGWVDEVVGDTGKDIFNGLVVSEGLFKGRRYVASERVAQIVEGRVMLDVGSADLDSLEEWTGAPPSLDVLPPDRA